VLSAKANLLALKLQLSKTHEQRLRHYEDTIKDAIAWEVTLAGLENPITGRGTIDVFKAMAFRLEVETALEMEKQKTK
jgi:hypothetical protein